MKIGIYGGIANNMYVFAKALASQGADVCFIRDRTDHYPFSQPVWEDVAFRLAYDDVPRADAWPWEQWSALEKQLGWTAPPWLFDPLAAAKNEPVPAPIRGRGLLDAFWLRRYLAVPHRSAALRKMQACDALLVCGIEGSILANLSGHPYVIWPHGGDMMIAAGLLQPKIYRIRRRIAHGVVQRRLVAAFAGAVGIGNHEPTGISTDYYGAESFIRRQKLLFMPIPIPVRERLAADARRQALRALLGEFGLEIPSRGPIGFVPSRLDYEWKGHDRLLRALVQLNQGGAASGLHLIFVGWGRDFPEAKRFAAQNGIADRITFLDSALSKPLLYRFYLAADFVIDQFVNGMYGTSALEAMACGAPLLTWLNEAFDRPWGTPPVINAKSKDDIAAALRELIAGRIDLERTGRSLQAWLGRVHNPATVVRDLLAMYRTARFPNAVPA